MGRKSCLGPGNTATTKEPFGDVQVAPFGVCTSTYDFGIPVWNDLMRLSLDSDISHTTHHSPNRAGLKLAV